MVLGDEPTAQRYGIRELPDAFLIDKRGNIAATYTGLVDRQDVESHIKTLLAQH
jgi:hypothetical protein